MKIILLFVGRTEAGHVGEGLEHYLARIRRSVPVDVLVIPDSKLRDGTTRVKEEEARIEQALVRATSGGAARVVVLDERGKGLTSTKLSGQLGAWRDQGVRRLVFVVGGAYGLHATVRDKADLVLGLSAMTFPHQLVRVILAEQIYRAFSILERKPYHH